MSLPTLSMTTLLTALALLHAPSLAGAPEPATARTPSTPSAFTVEKSGSGPPMILIPGFLSSGEVWDSTVAHYEERYQCHVLTLAGFAGLPPVEPPFLTTVRDAVIAYIRAEKLERPVLVGHSMGAFLAMSIAAAAPELAGPVVAVDGVPFYSALMNLSATAEGAEPAAAQLRRLYAGFDAEQMAAQSRMALRSMMKNGEDVERAVRWAAGSDPAAAGQAIYELMTTDLREAAGAIRSPLLLIAAVDFAQDDALRQRARTAYQAQVARVPDHRVVMATKARHFVMFDDPAFLFATVDAFLATPR